MISLNDVFFAEVQDTDTKPTAFEKSITLLLKKIIADSMAIRHLINLGFDVQAKTVLRTTAEYLEMLVAPVDDPFLSEEFVNSDSPEDAHSFWQKHLKRGEIRRRMAKAWRRVIGEEDPEGAANWLSNWGHNDYKLLSSLSHPSFAGGLFTAIPLTIKHTNEK